MLLIDICLKNTKLEFRDNILNYYSFVFLKQILLDHDDSSAVKFINHKLKSVIFQIHSRSIRKRAIFRKRIDIGEDFNF